MAKKIADAKAPETAAPVAQAAGGTSAPVVDGSAAATAANESGNPAPGESGALGIQDGAGAPLISNPASSDASAGITGAEGSFASGTGGDAEPPVQASGWPWEGQPIPDFLDRDGKVRQLMADEVRPIPVKKTVKIDGVLLEAGSTPLMPLDVYTALVAIDAVEEDD